MADITIFEFDLTDAQFYAPFSSGSSDDTATPADATAETDLETDTGGADGPSLTPLAVLLGLIALAYLVRRWRRGDGTDIEIEDVELEPDSETESQ